MKVSTRNTLTRILISIIYIVWALRAPADAYNAVITLNWMGMLVAAAELVMLFAGLFGLFGFSRPTCRVLGIITFLCSVASLVWAILSSGLVGFDIDLLVTALLGWLFVLAV